MLKNKNDGSYWICGEGIGTKQKREQSDYDDFFIASKKDAEAQLQNAKIFLDAVERYLRAL